VDGGYARDDVTAREILTTIALICQPVRGEQPSFNQRMTRVFMEGLCGSLRSATTSPRKRTASSFPAASVSASGKTCP
jgi:hypothetical protein